MEKLGASIGFQLIDIFNIIEDDSLSEQEKRNKISEYQKGLTTEGTGTKLPKSNSDEKEAFYIFGDVNKLSYENLLKTKEYVDKYLTSFTCEAEMKMPAILAGIDVNEKGEPIIKYNFRFADIVYNYAQKHEKDVRGHTLVWHKHFPDAIDEYIEAKLRMTMSEYENQHSKEDFQTKRKELTKQFLVEYIKTVGEHFPECYCWDVLNEIVPNMQCTDNINNPHAPTQEERKDGIRHSKWYEYLGEDYFIEVLKIARENLPEGTKLFYNEYGEEHPEKRKAIIDVIKKIKVYERDHQDELGTEADRKPQTILDGLGLQSHYNQTMSSNDIEAIYSDMLALQNWLQENNCSPLEIQVTEMDVSPGRNKNGEVLPINSDRYTQIWKTTFDCVKKYGISAFTGWGISDKLSWHKGTNCTMLDEYGKIKDFAKKFVGELYVKATIKNAIKQGISTEDIRRCDDMKTRE